jgi:glucan 1,3-beta-glucosidase
VILDLHGTPGGNSLEMHTGQEGQPGMWGKPDCYRRTAGVWRAVADRYKGRAVVAAYDLVNEPYADKKLDVRPSLLELMPQVYRAIREVDDRHVIFFPGALRYGIEFYGDPKQQGMHDVGFTEHRYAGLFGDKPVIESHARELLERFPKKQAYVARLGVPYLFGEFNVVLRRAGGDRVMREYYDRAAEWGWTATMWSYKLLKREGGVKPDPWYMVTNAPPLQKLDLRTSSYEDFEHFFQSLATMELAVKSRSVPR